MLVSTLVLNMNHFSRIDVKDSLVLKILKCETVLLFYMIVNRIPFELWIVGLKKSSNLNIFSFLNDIEWIKLLIVQLKKTDHTA